ncbi:MAG: prepilin-type N-terminal cleavage/methylation domain-containing protein [Opitutus sp.]
MATVPAWMLGVRRNGRAGFTLVELLVVVGLVALLIAVLAPGRSDAGQSMALKSAQAGIMGLLSVARTKAVASGQSSRILLNVDPTGSTRELGFLRYLVVQTQQGAAWQSVAEFYLPEGTYVVPGDFSPLPAGLFAAGASAWVRSDLTSPLRSSALRTSQLTTEAVAGGLTQKWVSIVISAAGSTAQTGDVVVALGQRRPPNSYAAGESPIQLVDPERVCGVTLSSYGLAVLIDNRASF